MELSNIAIFALIGALVAAIVAGGVLSMMDEDATTTSLGGGAAVGGLLGAAIAYLQDSKVDELVPDSIKQVISGGGSSSGYPDMKVGLPAF
jgi:hypothetical protein